MKLFHIADLHIGALLYGYSLKEYQEAALGEIVRLVRDGRPDALLISGDIFDRSAPSGEAYLIFDRFLNALGDITPAVPVLIIAGNHDSAQRLKFASGFLEKHRIYISVLPPQTPEEHIKKVTLTDAYGEVDFWMLPFFKPGYVRQLFPEGAVTDYTGAVREILAREDIDFTRRNVLLSHQFYQSGSSKEGDAPVIIGGLDKVDVDVIKDFDYAALGHVHGPQKVKYEHVRYSGTPLKYSVSEEHQEKGILCVELGEKGTPVKIERIPIPSVRDVLSLRGTLPEVLAQAPVHGKDFVSVTLTDEEEAWNAKQRLEEVYEALLEVRVDNARTRARLAEEGETEEKLSVREAFLKFYQEINRCPLGEREEKIMDEIFTAVGEEALS